MLLHRTQSSIAELAASRPSDIGEHLASQTVFGGSGLPAGAMEFDFAIHDVGDVDLFSMEEELTGQPHVSEVFPERPLDISVVMHCDPRAAFDPPATANARRVLVDSVYRSVKESVLFGDYTRLFVAGHEDPYLMDREAEYLEATEKPMAAAASVADICKDGLTLVISTFKNLPLDKASDEPYKNAVGVKANHLWDIALGSNNGKWDTGEADPNLRVINTDDRRGGRISKDLAAYRQVQSARHFETISRLEKAGVKMATAIFDKEFPSYFDVDAVDRSIADAIKRSNRR